MLALAGRVIPVLAGESYTWYVTNRNPGVAAAYAVLILIFTVGATWFYFRFFQTNAAEAGYHAWMLEFAAEMAAMALLINPRIRGVRQSLLDKHYRRKHGKDAYYGQGGGHG